MPEDRALKFVNLISAWVLTLRDRWSNSRSKQTARATLAHRHNNLKERVYGRALNLPHFCCAHGGVFDPDVARHAWMSRRI